MSGSTNEKKQGIRPSDAVYEMALATLEDLMLQRVPWPKIVAQLIEGGLTTSEHTIKDWRQEIRRRWAAQDQEERPHRRDEHREMLRQLYNASFVSGDFRNCEKVARQLMLLDGLHQPLTINHTGSVAVEQLTPAQRNAEIDKLLAKREAALKRQRDGAN